ncbi:hypothetical protein DFH07DRAFT_802397 [Mycena maculata]|uniref:Uncharacterized protein n=1 Tax=Mycena maculata TaxID=230809 RepID=A0AAD7JVL4_9AGAR|nr:hypothetical protein DFH07DRAFT_802397 [Mycena maculata]
MIRAMVTTQQKDYVDRGVQTDLPRQLSRPESSTSKPVNPRVYDPPAPITPPTTLKSGRSSYSPSFDHHSPTSGGHSIPVHATGPTRSPLTSRKRQQLPYSRPSQSNSITQRVLSLPETSPPFVTRIPRETRGVSLSERPRASLSFSDNTIESSGSAETSFLSANRSGSSRARRSFPSSSDVPHTPSPPSSPESVMIIGNDMQVPISFLRQKVKTSYEDDDGWISWANSPPKPIPALHGPLSLPYARCPSGAEGTIIEGEDLSRMIWGLGIDDGGGQSTHSRTNSTYASHKSTPQPSFPPRLQAQRHSQLSHQLHNAPPRHQHGTSRDSLSTPSLGGIGTITHDARNQTLLHQRALESLGPRHSSRGQTQDHRLNVPQNSDSWTDIYRVHDELGSLQDQLRTYDGQRGLGLDWQETLRPNFTPEAVRNKPPNSLKPSAPVFVPASQQATQQYHRIFVEPRIPHTINPPQRLTAIEIAHQYRAQHHPQNSLPTPPGSSSPQWAPHLPHYTDPFPPLDLHKLLPVKQQPNFTQQQLLRELQCPSDPSQELRQFVFDRIRNPDLNANHDYMAMSFGDSGLVDQNQATRTVFPASQYRKPTIDMSPPHPGPPPNSPLPPIPSSRIMSRARNFNAAPPSPTSPDTSQHRSLTRPPRSVPFARLLQRRLSSVPEEESGHYMERYSPPPSPPGPTTTTRTPRPPSYSLADSFQSRSHPGSIRRHARTPSPNRGSGFAPQTRTAGELESDEARRIPSAGRAKATVKLPLKTANSDTADSRGEGSTKTTDGSASEAAWEKENGKPRKKARNKKTKGGNADRSSDPAPDNVSLWLAASQGPEAWL